MKRTFFAQYTFINKRQLSKGKFNLVEQFILTYIGRIIIVLVEIERTFLLFGIKKMHTSVKTKFQFLLKIKNDSHS